MSSGSLLDVMRPRGRLVVEGAGLEAAVQDADEPVGQLAQGGVCVPRRVLWLGRSRRVRPGRR